MTRAQQSSSSRLVAAALVGVALLAIPGSPLEQRPTLGLDLQGGLEVTLQAVPPNDRKLTKEDLDRSVSIMRSRVDKLGVAEPEIRTQGSDQISIQLPGVKDPAAAAADHRQDRAARALRSRGATSSRRRSTRARGSRSRRRSSTTCSRASRRSPRRARPTRTTSSARRGRRSSAGPVSSKQAALAKWGGKLPPGHKLFAVPAEHGRRAAAAPARSCCPGVAQANPTTHVLVPDALHAARRAGDDGRGPEALGHASGLRHAHRRADRPHGLHRQGREELRGHHARHRTARQAPLQHRRRRAGRPQRRSSSTSRSCSTARSSRGRRSTSSEYPGGISGSNGAQISGLASVGEAKNLALVLQTGALPVEFRTLDQTAISATLGKDSLQEAKHAALVGLLAVALFLLIFYRFLGLVAVVGLIVYAALLYAAILDLQRHADAARASRGSS